MPSTSHVLPAFLVPPRLVFVLPALSSFFPQFVLPSNCNWPQAGSPTTSALETVVNADERVTAVRREIELLEADSEGADAAASAAHPPLPPTVGGEQTAVIELQREIAKLSLEEKATRLAEAYEDLDVLVRCWALSIFFRILFKCNFQELS